MTPPTVIAAFGTTTRAKATYRDLDKKIKAIAPDIELFWAYSSKQITKNLQLEGGTILSPSDVLNMLHQKGHKEAIVQSLHLFPGTEFHNLHKISHKIPIRCKTGLPLLTSPTDYQEIADLLAPTINSRPDRAILILGHGTTHPSWTGYYCLEKILRNNFGERIHVGVVEEFPDSAILANQIAASKYKNVTIIPFFLIAGMHYRRDIIAKDEHSWLSRLESLDLNVEVIDSGIGTLAGIEQLIVRHITQAKHS